MAGTFNLQIVTPEREVFNGSVETIQVPGMEGPFGVLRNHAPIIAALDPGLVQITDVDGAQIRMAVGGGFFQMADNEAMLLADSAETAADIDLARAQESEQRARARLAGEMGADFEMQRDRAQSALKRAQARLRVASNR